jgi:hypothetical protein
MLASPYHRITNSNSVRGIILWVVTCFTVFYVIDGLATRPRPVDVESFRKSGMNDEAALSMALQKANESRAVAWWIHDREAYLVFDKDRNYLISEATYTAFDLKPEQDSFGTPIRVFRQNVAGIQVP